MKNLAVLDFETTGLCAGEDRVIEVAAVIVHDGMVVDTFTELMNPGFRLPSFITRLTGITDAMISGKPSPEAVMPRLRRFLGDHICLAHNAAFDRRFFHAEMNRADLGHDRRFLCSMLLSRRLISRAPNYRLSTLVRHLRLSTPDGLRAHRALADVLMTCALWTYLLDRLKERLHGHRVDAEMLTRVMKQPKSGIDSFLETCAHSEKLMGSAAVG